MAQGIAVKYLSTPAHLLKSSAGQERLQFATI